MYLDKNQKFNLLKEATREGKFITVIFYKLDGTKRQLTGRTGVKKHLKGGKQSYNLKERCNLTIWSPSVNQYRTIKAESVIQLNCSGMKIKF